MESIAHSRQPNKVSAAFSKKSNGNHGGLPAKGLYDDVYGGPPKFGVNSLSPRFEDYGEIFGSFHTARTSSIPILDLPLVDENEVFFDIRSSAFDYGEVFGGYNGLDFAVSYEDLFHQPNVRDDASSEEAWTPEETDSISGESDRSGNNQSMSRGYPYHSVDGDTEFNISYHRVDGTGNGGILKGKTHIAEPQPLHGFTLVFDEATPMHSIDPSMQFPDDINLDVDLTTEKERENQLGKTSHPPDRTSGKQTFGDDLQLHDEDSRSGSHSREAFMSVTDINLRTRPSQVPPPSRPPPLLDVKKGHTADFHLNSEPVAAKGIPGDSSPPFFDVEVDMNSSAAASAATMKEAVHRVETKLRGAKELKEKKKEDFDSSVKISCDVKNIEGSRNITRSSSLKDERIQGASDGRHRKMKIPITDERQKTMKVVVETPDSLLRDRPLHMFEKSTEEKRINESRSSQESDRSAGAGTWKEETEFFELVGTEESPSVFQSVNHSKSLAKDVRTHENEWEANLQDESKMLRAIEEKCQLDEYKKKSKAAKEACELDKIIRSKASREDQKQKEHVKKGKLRKFSEQEENEHTRITHQHEKTEKKLTDVYQSGNSENTSQTQHKEVQQAKGEKLKEVDRFDEVHVMRLKEGEKKLKEADKQRDNVKKQKQAGKVKENDDRERKAFALGKGEAAEKQTNSMDVEENDGKLREAVIEDIKRKESCQREHEKSLKQTELVQQKEQKEAHEREDIEKILNGACRKEGEEGPKQTLEENNGKRPKEALDLEVNQIRLRETVGQERNDKRVKEAYERIHHKNTLEEACDACNGYEIESELQEADGIEGVQNVLNQGLEQDKNCGILEEAQSKEEIESPSNWEFDVGGSEATLNEDSHHVHSKKVPKSVDGDERDKELDKSLEQMEGNEDGESMKFAEEVDEILKTECDPNHLEAQSASNHEECIEKPEESQQSPAGHVIGRTKTECKVGEKKLEQVRMENLMANKDSREPEMSPGDAEHIGTKSGKVDDCVMNDDEVGFGSQETGVDKIKTASQQDTNRSNVDGKSAHEWNERGKDNQHVKISLHQQESKDKVSSTYPNPWDQKGRNTGSAKPATVLEVGNQKSTSQVHVGQSTEKKEKNINETRISEESDAERMRRERELERDRLRKIEEERQREREREKDRMAVDKAMLEAEREREREKDRMAVDRATLQARDRAFAETRDRADRAAFERATAEARQRALSEARERLEKACAEARDNKASAEARLKAERAAVERATAEARERAMEKAKAERAAFESRERLERSVSDTFATSFRSSGRQGFSLSDAQDSQFQNFSSSAGSRHPYSSVHACSFSERSEGGEGESAQRCRARLERYRRTAERAARALEEKNMRDLLAQKEQAERNRLAETLDAEVRRWSSGKEGNLRALLSTLQYILGPDSGWQPIPLTEVITSAAVKKAYRKATLCVHPDKLQQRGASIQHKYICEKVFDLLKEAWNKFNSEER
ncbi:auxilin-like protein 1 isoform X1 [Neltuma alba]|uniref:auxilin-like protein 1 isoform X1 n=2 Tax=Neltuma alba TaxID=207710 RepID=UPI0010A4EFA2|nr:auxilin-like protein 1 isoform X1 [Prosopis alba]